MSGSTISSVHDGNLLYLTDNAYVTLLDHESGHRWSPKGKNRQDGLFMERLDSFLEAQQKEIQLFANREQRPLDEIRKLVAIPHARYILSLDPRLPTSEANSCETRQADTSVPSIRSTLGRISSTLQLLHSAAGLDSLLVVVSPRSTSDANPTDSGNSQAHSTREASWIGGTELGKEFWMGLKGGGVNGARAFRMKCQMRREAELQPQSFHSPIATAAETASHHNAMPAAYQEVRTAKVRSKDVKIELNAAVRQALRSISGNPSAEMRWTKPASLEESYNVRLIGWPSTISMRNPSNNTLKENRILLDLVRSGEMRFVTRGSPEWNCLESTTRQVTPGMDESTQLGNSIPLASGNLRSHPLDSSKYCTPVSPTPHVQSLSILSQVQFTPSSCLPYQNSSLTAVSSGDIRQVSISPPTTPITPLQLTSDLLPAPGEVASKRRIEECSEEQDTHGPCEAKRARFDTEIETE